MKKGELRSKNVKIILLGIISLVLSCRDVGQNRSARKPRWRDCVSSSEREVEGCEAAALVADQISLMIVPFLYNRGIGGGTGNQSGFFFYNK